MSPEIRSQLESQRRQAAQILLEADCVEVAFKPIFTFSTGIKSPIKVDCEKLAQSRQHFDKIVSKLEAIIKSTFGDYRFFCGVIKGGVLFSDELAKRFNVKSVHRLGIKQDSQRAEMVAGAIGRNEKGIIIEDVLTTGLNAGCCIQRIRHEGGAVLGFVTIFDYGFPTARRKIRWDYGLNCWTLTTFDQLLKVGQEMGNFTSDTAAKLEDWWTKTNRDLLTDPKTATIVS